MSNFIIGTPTMATMEIRLKLARQIRNYSHLNARSDLQCILLFRRENIENMEKYVNYEKYENVQNCKNSENCENYYESAE